MNEDNVFKDGSALLAALSIVVICMLCVMGMMMHLYNSLVDAINTIQLCQADGASECRIERDGFHYSVYGKVKYED